LLNRASNASRTKALFLASCSVFRLMACHLSHLRFGSSGAGARRGPLICGRSLRPRGCASLEKECHGGQLARSTNPAEVRHRRVQEREATDRGAEREAQIHEGRVEREDDRRELQADDLDQARLLRREETPMT